MIQRDNLMHIGRRGERRGRISSVRRCSLCIHGGGGARGGDAMMRDRSCWFLLSGVICCAAAI